MTIDRRRSRQRTHTVTLGGVLVSLGAYAFGPYDTLFVSGMLMVLSGFHRNRLLSWGANAVAGLVCGWTALLFIFGGVVTPTVSACLVIAVGAFASMLRDAFEGQRMRCSRDAER